MPPKDFVPTHSAEETASINAMIVEKMSFIKEERAEKKCAVWKMIILYLFLTC